jgi:hypothetical protein
LAYERANGAFWDLFDGVPISYPGKPPGFRADLKSDHNWLPLERMTWRAWRRLHGNTRVMSRDTGYEGDYAVDPYATAVGPDGQPANYWTSASVLAPDDLRDASLTMPDKDWVLGFLAQGQPWAVPLRELVQSGQAQVTVATVAGSFTVRAWPADDRFLVEAVEGAVPPQLRGFWFAWKARFPDTRVWRPAPTQP